MQTIGRKNVYECLFRLENLSVNVCYYCHDAMSITKSSPSGSKAF